MDGTQQGVESAAVSVGCMAASTVTDSFFLGHEHGVAVTMRQDFHRKVN